MIYAELLWEVFASGFSLQLNCIACFHEHSCDGSMVSSTGNDVKVENSCRPQMSGLEQRLEYSWTSAKYPYIFAYI